MSSRSLNNMSRNPNIRYKMIKYSPKILNNKSDKFRNISLGDISNSFPLPKYNICYRI